MSTKVSQQRFRQQKKEKTHSSDRRKHTHSNNLLVLCVVVGTLQSFQRLSTI